MATNVPMDTMPFECIVCFQTYSYGPNGNPVSFPCGHSCCLCHVSFLTECPICGQGLPPLQQCRPNYALRDAAVLYKKLQQDYLELEEQFNELVTYAAEQATRAANATEAMEGGALGGAAGGQGGGAATTLNDSSTQQQQQQQNIVSDAEFARKLQEQFNSADEMDNTLVTQTLALVGDNKNNNNNNNNNGGDDRRRPSPPAGMTQQQQQQQVSYQKPGPAPPKVVNVRGKDLMPEFAETSVTPKPAVNNKQPLPPPPPPHQEQPKSVGAVSPAASYQQRHTVFPRWGAAKKKAIAAMIRRKGLEENNGGNGTCSDVAVTTKVAAVGDSRSGSTQDDDTDSVQSGGSSSKTACGHKCTAQHTAYSDKCCHCMDTRPQQTEGTYPTYKEGRGWTQVGNRNDGYCVECKGRSYSPSSTAHETVVR